MKVAFRDADSSFGKQLQSTVATSATFHFGSDEKRGDSVVVDAKLNNCADNLAKKVSFVL